MRLEASLDCTYGNPALVVDLRASLEADAILISTSGLISGQACGAHFDAIYGNSALVADLGAS